MCLSSEFRRILDAVGAGLIATYVAFGQFGCGYYDPMLLVGLISVACSQKDRIASLIQFNRRFAACVAIPVVVLLAWIANAHWYSTARWGTGGIDAASGTLLIYTGSIGPVDLSIRTSQHWHWKWEWPTSYHKNWSAGGTHLVPMWLIQIVSMTPLGVATISRRKRLSPEQCRTCGYNLTGNVSGICSECGHVYAKSA